MLTFARFALFILSALVLVAPALAQDDPAAGEEQTFVVTEDQINESYRIANPARAVLSDLVVDLQPAQAVIDFTYTARSGNRTTAVQMTLVPEVMDGDVEWLVTDVVVADPLEANVVERLSEAVTASWEAYWRTRARHLDVTDVMLTDTEIIYTYIYNGRDLPIDPDVEITEETIIVTLTEADINSSYRVINPRRGSLSDLNADLQPGQAVLSAVFTPQRGEDTFVIAATVVPTLAEGDVTWEVTEISVNGDAPQTEISEQVAEILETSWVNYWRQRIERREVLDVTITEDAITYTYSRMERGDT